MRFTAFTAPYALGEVLGVTFLPCERAPDPEAWAQRVAAQVRASAGDGTGHTAVISLRAFAAT